MLPTVLVDEQKRKGRVFLQAIGVRIMPSHTLTRRVRAWGRWPRPPPGAIGGAHGRFRAWHAPSREEAATVVCSLPRVHDKCSRLDVVVLTCRAVIGQWARRGAVVETCRVGETSCVRKVCGETASGLSWSWLFSPRHHGRALAVAILCPPSPCARRA